MTPSLTSYALSQGIPGFDPEECVQAPLKNPKVRFRKLAVEDDALRARLLEAVDRVLRSGQLIMGQEVLEFERRIAEACGRRQGVGVASGTSALFLALAAHGIGSGDEVITTPLSALGSVNCIAVAGATPVFVDVASDLNIDAALIEAAITPRTKAILPVHYTGRLCDMGRILDIARRHNLIVVEDASQAWGARCHLGSAGGLGDVSAISISQMKILNSYGEGGIVLTDSAEMAERLVSLRYLGSVNREICIEPHLNHKIDTIQAAMTLVAFDQAEPSIARRLDIARRYHEGLSDLVTCPEPPAGADDRRCVFFDYTIATPHRKMLRRWMEEKGVEVKIRHPLHFGQQPCYQHLSSAADLPMATRLVGEILSLPIHEKLTDDEIAYVIKSVTGFFRQGI